MLGRKSAMKQAEVVLQDQRDEGVHDLHSRAQNEEAAVVATTGGQCSEGPAEQDDNFFVAWREPGVTMPRVSGSMAKRKPLPPRQTAWSEEEQGQPPRRMRQAGERRSKAREDVRVPAPTRRRGGARNSSPPAKKTRVTVDLSQSEEDDDDEPVEEMQTSGGLREQSWSRGYDAGSGAEDSDGDTDDFIEELHPQVREKAQSSTAMKKPIELDIQGRPFGSMKDALSRDVGKYAKDLDPRTGWEGQPRHLRRRFFQRIYTDWQMCGDSDRVNEKFLQPIITKSLITVRHKMNKLIDAGLPRPEDFNPEYWKGLQELQGTEAAQQKSAVMRSISKGKGSSSAQVKAIEREVVSRLTMLKGRPPYDPEVDAEVASEQKRILAEKRKIPDYSREIDDVRNRVTELESSVHRLGDDMAASHKRLEDMMQKLLQSPISKLEHFSKDVPNLLPSGQLQEEGGLPSTTQTPASPLQKDGTPALLTAEATKGATPSTPIAVDSDVHADVLKNARTQEEVVAADVMGDDPAPAEEEDSKSVDVAADGEEVRNVQQEENVYEMGNPSEQQPPTDFILPDSETPIEKEDDEHGSPEASSRARRLPKNAAPAKAAKPSGKANTPKPVAPRAPALPKGTAAAAKLPTTKKAEATRKK